MVANLEHFPRRTRKPETRKPETHFKKHREFTPNTIRNETASENQKHISRRNRMAWWSIGKHFHDENKSRETRFKTKLLIHQTRSKTKLQTQTGNTFQMSGLMKFADTHMHASLFDCYFLQPSPLKVLKHLSEVQLSQLSDNCQDIEFISVVGLQVVKRCRCADAKRHAKVWWPL